MKENPSRCEGFFIWRNRHQFTGVRFRQIKNTIRPKPDAGFLSQNGALSGSTELILKLCGFLIFKAELCQDAESNPAGVTDERKPFALRRVFYLENPLKIIFHKDLTNKKHNHANA